METKLLSGCFHDISNSNISIWLNLSDKQLVCFSSPAKKASSRSRKMQQTKHLIIHLEKHDLKLWKGHAFLPCLTVLAKRILVSCR